MIKSRKKIFWSGNLMGIYYLVDLVVHGRVILRWFLKKLGLTVYLTQENPEAGCSKLANVHLASTEGGELSDKLTISFLRKTQNSTPSVTLFYF
jgi:hypothetical protein